MGPRAPEALFAEMMGKERRVLMLITEIGCQVSGDMA